MRRSRVDRLPFPSLCAFARTLPRSHAHTLPRSHAPTLPRYHALRVKRPCHGRPIRPYPPGIHHGASHNSRKPLALGRGACRMARHSAAGTTSSLLRPALGTRQCHGYGWRGQCPRQPPQPPLTTLRISAGWGCRGSLCSRRTFGSEGAPRRPGLRHSTDEARPTDRNTRHALRVNRPCNGRPIRP